MSDNTNTPKGWSLIGEALQNAGVEYIFGLPGESISPVQYAVEHTPIEIVTTRHEQAATFMAEAYARITGKPGVALVTVGPGFTNTLSAVVSARMANVPIVLIAGGQKAAVEDRLSLQDMRQSPIIESIVKKTLICKDSNRVAEYIDMAFRIAANGCPGPVFLELPVDILFGDVNMEAVSRFSTHVASRPFDPNDALRIIEMIEASRQPVILAGSGAHSSRASEALTQFVDLTGIPTFTLKMGRGVISDDHPLCFGSSAVLDSCGPMATGESDLLIVLGTRLCLFTANGKLFNPNARIIQVDIEPEEIGRNKSITLPVFADVKALLKECCDLINDKGNSKDLKQRFYGWAEKLKSTDAAAKENIARKIANTGELINPGFLAKEVDRFMDRDDDIVIADGGDCQTWMAALRTCRQPGTILDPLLFGCLGIGIPFGIAAKLVNPDRRVLVYTGDGAFGFNFMEIETSLRKNLPVVIVIDNNKKWGMTSNSMKLDFEHHVPGTVEMGNPPYHKAVEALGGKGILVEKADDIQPALEEAFASGVVTCVNVMTDPEIIGPGSEAMALLKNL